MLVVDILSLVECTIVWLSIKFHFYNYEIKLGTRLIADFGSKLCQKS